MYGLTQEEVDLLLKNPDPKIAAAALKLKELEEKGEFIPKSRLSSEIQDRKRLEDQLKTYLEKEKAETEAKKKAEEDEAKKRGEFEKLLEAQKAETVRVQALVDAEKKDADAYRGYRKTAMEEAKKQLGPKWSPEFENLSIEALLKLPGIEKIGVFHEKQQIQPDDIYTMDELKAMSQEQVSANLEKVNRSLSKQKQ